MDTRESDLYETKEIAFVNVGISISKEIKVNDKFSLPLSLFVYN